MTDTNKTLWRVLDPTEIENNALSGWQLDSYARFSAMMDAPTPGFPCIFGLRGWKRGQLRFLFGDESDHDAQRLGAALRSYLAVARNLGPYTSLVVAYAPERELCTEAEYAQRFWAILQRLHDADEKPWPSQIPRSTDDPQWDFCFEGEPLFVPAMLPCYVHRRSRGSHSFGLMFQPRWVFDALISDTRKLERARRTIRTRAAKHDDVPVHPAIGVYGEGDNVEWRQYVLPDDNDTVLNRCPLRIGQEETPEGDALTFVPID